MKKKKSLTGVSYCYVKLCYVKGQQNVTLIKESEWGEGIGLG